MKGGRKMRAAKRKGCFLLIAIFLLGACSGTTGNVYREKGLVTGKPGMNVYPGEEPGETSPLDRPYAIAPPLVPHSVAGLAINQGANECLDCHLEGVEVEEGHRAPKVPPSHFRNDHTGEVKTGGVVGIRYICTQCHVPPADEGPPVPQIDIGQ